MEHFVAPLRVVRQQVTNPGFPQVDLAAHRLMLPEVFLGMVPALTLVFTACATQRT